MSVINSMLRDLDRRNVPLPIKTRAQPTLVHKHRAWPRAVFALCVLIIVVMWSWGQRSQQTIEKNANVPPAAMPVTKTVAKTVAGIADTSPLPPGEGKGEGDRSTENFNTAISPSRAVGKASSDQINVIAQTDKKSGTTSTANKLSEKPALTSAPLPQGEGRKAPRNNFNVIGEQSAPIIKQERINPNALNDERYQLARAALAQNQPQRAYELLRDTPPPMADALDYHAVLAAVEQQLGHYADASLRYQQLLMLDQKQASWWLGLALSLEGEHRSSDALDAYQRAAALNALPDAARQYVAARIAALGSRTGQKVEAEH